MYERSYGNNYDGDRPVKEDAAIIRKTIRKMAKDGELPADWKYSVRYRTASMMSAIDVHVTAPEPTLLMEPVMLFSGPEGRVLDGIPIDGKLVSFVMRPNDRHEIRWGDVAKPKTKAVRETLEALVASYNHDGSESMIDYFDVKFYGHVDITTADGVDRFEHEAPPTSVRVAS